MEVVCTAAENADAAERGFFFEGAGAIKFSDAAFESPGYASAVVVADRYGVVAYSDLQAVYIALTNQLLKAASQDVKSPEVLDPATVCVAKLSLAAVTCLSLSADQLLLACVAGSVAQVFSLPHLLHHQSDAPVHSIDLGSALLQFAWCPGTCERDSTSWLALTAERVLVYGSLLSGSEALADDVECGCWSPDGQHVAYSSGNKLVVTAPDWKDTAFVVSIPEPDGESGDGRIVLDSLAWPAPGVITGSSLWYDDSADEPEGADGYLLGISWSSWQGTAEAAPEGLQAQLTSYVVFEEDPGCLPHEWPYLHGVYVPAWRLYVHSHRRASDDHIRLVDCSRRGEVLTLDQGETKLLAAVPTVQDRENFVVGLALDYSNQAAIPHPMDDQKPDVPASCVLLVATLDGVLRLYRLANFQQEAGLARPAAAVPAGLPQQLVAALQAAAQEAQFEEESDSSVSSPSPPVAALMQQGRLGQPGLTASAASAATQHQPLPPAPPAQQQQQQQQALPGAAVAPEEAAAAVALPSDDFDEEDEDDSEQELQQVRSREGDAGSVGGRPGNQGGAPAEGGWGSSEDGDGSEEATSAAPPAARPGRDAFTPPSKVLAAAGFGAPVAGSSQASGSSTFSALGGFGGASGSQPFGASPLFGAPAQPFGAASSQPAFSFATGGGGGQAASGSATITTGSDAQPGSTEGASSAAAAGSASAVSWPAAASSAQAAPGSSAPAFGSSDMFKAASTPAFGSFGSSTPAFGGASSTPAFGGVSSAPAFGSFGSSAPAFGAASAAAAGQSGAAGSSASPFSGVSLGGVGAPVFGGAAASQSQPASGQAAAALPSEGPFADLVAAFRQEQRAPAAAAAVPADQFQPSLEWQGPRPGFVFSTGQHGTGYYKDTAPPPAPAPAAAQPAPQAALPAAASAKAAAAGSAAGKLSRAGAGGAATSSGTSAAASQARPAAAAAGAAAARRAAQLQQQQPAAQQSKPQPQLPAVKVSAPKPQLLDQGQEVAEAEAAFLRSLHSVAQMSAQLQALTAAEVPRDIQQAPLCRATTQLRQEAARLARTHKQQKQAASGLLDSWDEVTRQQAALVMFHPAASRTSVIQAELPLEPALAGLRDGIQASLEALASNMEDLEQQLERQLDQQQQQRRQQQSPAAAWAAAGRFGRAAVVFLVAALALASRPVAALGSQGRGMCWGLQQ